MNKGKKNILLAFGGQILLIALGFVIPKITMTNYGSDVNGVLGTVAQIYVYLALLEGGIAQVTKKALYLPISKADRSEISIVVATSRYYYRKVSRYYAVAVLAMTFLLPLFLKSQVNFWTIAMIVFWEGLSNVLTFAFSSTWQQLLYADGKGYVVSIFSVFGKTLSNVVKIVLAYMSVNIALIQFGYFIVSLVTVIGYAIYFKRQYPWLDPHANIEMERLNERRSFLISEIAWVVFSSTDMILLSAVVSTQLSSVYSVYNMIFTHLSVLLNAVFTNTNYVLGQALQVDRAAYIKLHDLFTSVFLGAMTIMMCIAYYLCLPFIALYTANVQDVQYIRHALPLLFCLINMLSWSRYVTGNLTAIAGYAKKTMYASVIEASLNVVLSFVCVFFWQLEGVLLATVLALPVKVIYLTYLSEKKILKRSGRRYLSILGINFLMFFAAVLIEKRVDLQIHNYVEFIYMGITLTIIFTVIGVVLNAIANRDILDYVHLRMKKRQN